MMNPNDSLDECLAAAESAFHENGHKRGKNRDKAMLRISAFMSHIPLLAPGVSIAVSVDGVSHVLMKVVGDEKGPNPTPTEFWVFPWNDNRGIDAYPPEYLGEYKTMEVCETSAGDVYQYLCDEVEENVQGVTDFSQYERLTFVDHQELQHIHG